MSYKDGLDQTFAPSWVSTKGDEIEGVVLSISGRDYPPKFNKPGQKYPILTVARVVNTGTELETAQLTTTELAVHCITKVLAEWVGDDEPRVGDFIIVRDDGKVRGKSGVEYQAFSKTIIRYETLPANLKRAGTQPSTAVAPPFVTGAPPAPAPAPAPAAAPQASEPW